MSWIELFCLKIWLQPQGSEDVRSRDTVQQYRLVELTQGHECCSLKTEERPQISCETYCCTYRVESGRTVADRGPWPPSFHRGLSSQSEYFLSYSWQQRGICSIKPDDISNYSRISLWAKMACGNSFGNNFYFFKRMSYVSAVFTSCSLFPLQPLPESPSLSQTIHLLSFNYYTHTHTLMHPYTRTRTHTPCWIPVVLFNVYWEMGPCDISPIFIDYPNKAGTVENNCNSYWEQSPSIVKVAIFIRVDLMKHFEKEFWLFFFVCVFRSTLQPSLYLQHSLLWDSMHVSVCSRPQPTTININSWISLFLKMYILFLILLASSQETASSISYKDNAWDMCLYMWLHPEEQVTHRNT